MHHCLFGAGRQLDAVGQHNGTTERADGHFGRQRRRGWRRRRISATVDIHLIRVLVVTAQLGGAVVQHLNKQTKKNENGITKKESTNIPH